MEKWTGPLQDPPFWLDRSREVLDENEPPKMPRDTFVIRCLEALVALDVPIVLAVDVAANTMNETGWGQKYKAWNLGGWKITKSTSHAPTGEPRFWWRALGNKSSNDPQTCFYRAFNSLEEFYAEWIAKFVPKAQSGGRYAKTGLQFWSGNPWFDDLIEAGYKGSVTKKNPAKSLAEHEELVKAMQTRWVQHVIGVAPDGAWGPKSKAAAAAKNLPSASAISAWNALTGTPVESPKLDADLGPQSSKGAPAESPKLDGDLGLQSSEDAAGEPGVD